MYHDLTIITPTGNRQLAFSFCERWMKRAILYSQLKVQWIVVDDGDQPTACTLGQEHLRRTRMPGEFWNSTLRNYRYAIENGQIAAPNVLIIEDDDWFAEDYIQWAVDSLSSFELVGEGDAVLFHAGAKKIMPGGNTHHAGLSGTAFKAGVLPWIREFCADPKNENDMGPYLDQVLWWSYVPEKKLLRQPHAGEPRRLVLMKGFPGRAGIALAGHAEQNPSYVPDTDLRYLSSLIGEADLQAYVQWGVIAR